MTLSAVRMTTTAETATVGIGDSLDVVGKTPWVAPDHADIG